MESTEYLIKNNSELPGFLKKFLGKEIKVTIDRPLGSIHPEFGFVYEVNYGYVPGIKMPDGDDLDAYCLGWDKPSKSVRGKVMAIIHRLNDNDDKLVVVAKGFNLYDGEIGKFINFQEKWFESVIIRE